MSEGVSILIVAGEDSGDQHAAGLIERLKQICSGHRLELFGSGGKRMAEQGVEILADVSQLAAIGPRAALANAGGYWKLYRKIVQRVRGQRPQLAILVDFPEFNLMLARRLKDMDVPVCYFISPQIWAWRTSRVEKVRRFVDLMLVILPFEEEFYRRHGVRSHYVGNPSLQEIRPLLAQNPAGPGSSRPDHVPRVALMPGSRRKEVEQIFPLQLQAARYISQRLPVRFKAVAAKSLGPEELEQHYLDWQGEGGIPLDLEFAQQPVQAALQDADFAIVKSGTSTLEAMLLGVPFAMVYRMSSLSWLLARPLVRIDTYCLANIVAGERVVEEFVQGGATAERIGEHVLRLLQDGQARQQMRRKLSDAAGKLGSLDAYQEAARRVADWVFLRKEAA
ncbi:MAG: lipid-A-disaccharide synthase [Acidobacteriota bacterium]